MSRQIYLGRSGVAYGPFSPDEFEAMREGGQAHAYGWYWDTEDPRWQAIDPAPAAIGEITVIAPDRTKPIEPIALPAAKIIRSVRPVEAVCHDFQQAITGRLEQVTEIGCEILCQSSTAGFTGPSFSSRSRLVLNLLDAKTGKSMSIPVKLTNVQRRQGKWTYSVQWSEFPEIVRAA